MTFYLTEGIAERGKGRGGRLLLYSMTILLRELHHHTESHEGDPESHGTCHVP